jgi:predicted PurR-regulated permease PerM
MQFVHRTTLRVLVTATLYGIAVMLIYFAYPALVAIAFSFFLAYDLGPIVKVFESRVWHSRLGAIALAYVALAAVITGFVLLLGAKTGDEISSLNSKGPAYWAEIKAGRIPAQLAKQAGPVRKFGETVLRWTSRKQAWVEQLGRRIAYLATDIAAFIFWSVLVMILGVFVLKDKDRWIQGLTREPDQPSNRKRIRSMLVEIDRAMARYIWSLLILSAISFGAFAVVLSLLRIPSAILLAAVAGLLELIFVFGPITAGVVILGAAILGGHNVVPVFIFLIGWRILQDYVNAPLLFGKRLQLHPLAVVTILMIGWSIGRILGMFLAVPIVAVGQIIWETWTTQGTATKDLAALFEDRRAA